jgi:hypothetical protein
MSSNGASGRATTAIALPARLVTGVRSRSTSSAIRALGMAGSTDIMPMMALARV